MDWAPDMVAHLVPSGWSLLVVSGFLAYNIRPLTLGCLVFCL